MKARTFTKKRTRECVCQYCSKEFLAADVKAKTCDACREPKPCRCGCGYLVKKPGRYWAPGHNPNTQSEEAHAKQAAWMCTDENPSKRPEVREAISRSLKANHPSKLYPEKWAALARNMKPTKSSGLEKALAPYLPDYDRNMRVGYYEIDFVDIETKTAIEVQGCYWHCCPYCFPVAKYASQKTNQHNDKRKNTYLSNRGWRLIYIWECLVTSLGPEETVKWALLLSQE